jgi:hypothetical protein
MSFYSFPDIVEDDFDRVRSKIEGQSGSRRIGYMKKMSTPCFGVTRSLTGLVVATLLQKYDCTAKFTV